MAMLAEAQRSIPDEHAEQIPAADEYSEERQAAIHTQKHDEME